MALAALLLLAACSSQRHATPGGPVVLITLDALRADAVGGLGGDPRLTPYLTRFLRQADWVGRGVASSSWGVPAMASLFTGLSPWQHHAILDGDAELADDLLTLPRAFKALGYRTAGFSGGRWYTAEYGYDRGFDTFDVAGRNREAAELLESLEGGKVLVWVHITQPDTPFVRRDWLLPSLAAGVPAAELRALPRLIEPAEVEAHADPAVPLPAAELRRLKLMYQLNVAWADEKVGRLLDALQASGQWDRSLVVVAADYGEEMGEQGVVGHGDDLARASLEVPLAVKLPSWCRRPLAVARGERAALTRVWATLVEAAGGSRRRRWRPACFMAPRTRCCRSSIRATAPTCFRCLRATISCCGRLALPPRTRAGIAPAWRSSRAPRPRRAAPTPSA